MQTTEIDKLATALAKAQPRFGQIRRDKTVKVRTKAGAEYTFQYAPLETILEAVRIPLSEVGLALVHPIECNETHITCGAMLMHSSGQWLASHLKFARPALMQELGSALTYCKRYCTQAVLGVQADDDDDANSADGNHIAEQKVKAPRRAPGSVSKAETSADREKIKADKIAALDAAGEAAFGDGAVVPIDDRQENPREVESKKAAALAFVSNMTVPTDAGRCRKQMVQYQADGLMTEADLIEVEAAIVEKIASMAGLMPGTSVKQPKKELAKA